MIAHAALAVVVLSCIVSDSYRTIALPWFTMTEEFPYAQEVLRALSGDFRQRFFDIPGTPFIGVVTAICAVILVPVSLVTGRSTTIAELAFQNLELLYLIMRCVSLIAFAVAAWLVFSIARRIASPWAALLGAVVLAAHPILGQTLYHTRIEPFALMLVSACILAWLRGVESGRWGWYAAAGLLGGLAMAARFPYGLATLPVLVFYALAQPAPLTGPGPRIDRSLAVSFLGVGLLGGGLAVLRAGGLIDRSRLTDAFFLSIHHGGYPRATRAIAGLWILLGVLGLAVLAMAAVPRGRRLIAGYLHSSLLSVVAFFPVGLLIGVPTLFAGADFFLASIEMFVERNVLDQPNVGRGAWNVVAYYVFGEGGLTWLVEPGHGVGARIVEAGALFTIPLVVLFGCGLVARPANRLLHWSAILGCVVGVASQFGKLHSTRHLAGWLPWFSIVIAVGGDWLARRTGGRRRVLAPLGAVLVALLFWQRELQTRPLIDHLVEKGRLQGELDRWLLANVSSDDRVFHTCCEAINASVVFGWMSSNGVDVPARYLESGSRIGLASSPPFVPPGRGTWSRPDTRTPASTWTTTARSTPPSSSIRTVIRGSPVGTRSRPRTSTTSSIS